MALRFIGKDPNTQEDQSPTVWVDESHGGIVLQGWKITDESTMAEIRATGPVPEHETVLRLPARMAPILKEAIDGGRPTDA